MKETLTIEGSQLPLVGAQQGCTEMIRITHIESSKTLMPAYKERCFLGPAAQTRDTLTLTAQDW